MKTIATIILMFLSCYAYAQVGVGNTDPKASLDISASNTTTPTNEDGILIPRVDNFPVSNPGADQDGMLVFATGNGAPSKGFYYWDNVTSSWVSVQGNEDRDWLKTGTSGPANNITDNIYTLGQVQIGSANVVNTSNLKITSDLTSNFSGLQLLHSGSDSGEIGYGIYNQSTITDAIRFTNFYNANSGTHNSTHYGFENFFINNGSGEKVGLYNEFDLSAPNGNKKGVFNRFEGGNNEIFGIDNSMPGAWTVVGNIYGINNNIRSGGNGQHYGVKTELAGLGSGSKFGYFVDISSTAGGTHYGIYSDVRNTSGYAAYFRGRVSFGSNGINRYFMPTQDGTTNQLITTDGFGHLNFVDASSVFTDTDNQNLTTATLTGTTLNLGIQNGTGTSVNLASLTDDNDWVTVGANIERQSGDVYIGDTNTTNNSLYVSGSIIDWDNTIYNIDLNATSNLARLELDSGISSLPALTIGDNNTGFYSISPGEIAHSGNGTLTFNIFSDGEITFRGSSPSLYDFSSYNVYENAGVLMGTSNSNSPLLYGFIQNDANDDIAEFEVLSGNSGFSHSAVYAHNNIGSNEVRLAYNTSGANYAVHAISPSNYAGYFRGTVQLGTSTTNRYNMPPSDGTAGQVMTTDGAGNVTFQNANSDVDFYELGTSTPPNNINDDKATLGTITIGGNAAPTATLNVLDTDGPYTAGIRSYRTFSNNTSITRRGLTSFLESAASNNDYLVGYYSQLAGTMGPFSYNYAALNDGSVNTFNVHYNGNYFNTSGTGNLFGTNVNFFSGVTNTGYKYGHRAFIDSSIPGVHFGLVSDVQKANSFSGMFIGRVSIGNDPTANRYILPTVDGTSGQVMTTDGAGNVTFQNPTANTDDQQIDNFSFNSSTNILTLEMEADGQAPQTVDLSSLNPSKSIARIYMSVAQTETGGGVAKVNFDTVDFDVNNDFNTTTDVFEVPVTGLYRVTAQITLASNTGTGVFGVRVRVNGSQERRSEYNHHGNGELVRQVTSILNLTAGQTLDVSFLRPAIGATIDQNARATFFEIEQLN
ncbi:hypothetical protein ACU8DI_12655 [Psychroserpens sp. BH13MA-6]